MSNFSIEDNSLRSFEEMGLAETDVDNLTKIANVNLCDLQLDGHPNLLVFPESWNKYHDDIHKSQIIEIGNGKIRTGNIMGFVGVNETKLSITSRFTPGRNDFFLHYMLMKVLSLNVLDLKHSTDTDSSFDFLIYLFPRFLQRALRQGIFKTYIRKEYNDSRLKGSIDFARHIKSNIPFNGRIAYNTREYSTDNDMTQLVRHTIEYIKGNRFAGNILSSSKEIRDAVATIQLITPTFNKQQRSKIIAANLRPLQHPYFSEYKPLQKLCLAILRHDELKYGYKKDEIYGVLFDGAWLWEEYLNTILSKADFTHAENKTSKNGIPVLQNKSLRWYPDFHKNEMVLDAKYKMYDERSVQAEDWQQVISYMYLLRASKGGLVFPSIYENYNINEVGKLTGFGGDLFSIPFPIPQKAENMTDFASKIIKSEDYLICKAK